MSVLIPKDRRCTTHVFCLHQLMAMLHAAGHIKLPPETRIIGSAVDQYGNLEVGFEYGAAYHGPNAQVIHVRHDFSEEIALQAQIAHDAETGRARLMDHIKDDLKVGDPTFVQEMEQKLEEQRFQADQQAKLQEEMEQANLSEHSQPVSYPPSPVPQEVQNLFRDRIKDLYPKAHPEKTFTPYAFIFQGSPLERDASEVVVPFIPGESVLNVLDRLKRLARDREMSFQMYECFHGIVQRVHDEGNIATAEAAKSYLRSQNYLIVFPAGAAKAA